MDFSGNIGGGAVMSDRIAMCIGTADGSWAEGQRCFSDTYGQNDAVAVSTGSDCRGSDAGGAIRAGGQS